MKTEQKLEIYRELFGSLPIPPEGKELVGVCTKFPEKGGLFKSPVNKSWGTWGHAWKCASLHPVAIFQDTHRADGTPLSIDPLPEAPKGYRVEYAGVGVTGLKGANGYYCLGNTSDKTWNRGSGDPNGYIDYHYARLYKIAQPTTLADLVGEDGQKNFYCIYGGAAGYIQGHIEEHGGELTVNNESFEVLEGQEIRWSHSPFTKYEDANEFVPE